MSKASSALVAAVRKLTDAVGECAVDPVDGVRLLLALAQASPPPASPYPTRLAGQLAALAMLRRSALISLARVCARYNPASSSEAAALRDQVCEAFDSAILQAGDAGSTGVYRALRRLRSAVAADLAKRAISLPALVTVTLPQSEPSLVAAWKLFGTVRREPGMVARAGVVHPLFMPLSFEALSR